MRDNELGWNDAKAASNLAKHGVSFGAAFKALDDDKLMHSDDSGQAAYEARFCAIGMVDERLILVSYSYRGERIRIISARPANSSERRRYHDGRE